MSAKRRRLSNKEYQRLLRARAEEEAKARSESEERQERIKELWELITRRKLMRGDESQQTARDLDLQSEIAEVVFGEWETEKKREFEKGLRRRHREDTQRRRFSNEEVRYLAELVALQRVEINYMRQWHALCEWAKTHAPDKLAALQDQRLRVVRAVLARANKVTPKQAYEQQMRSSPRGEVGLIEYEFGGEAQARARLRYDPTCLDDIMRGYGVDMGYLEILFGMERHRFPKKLQGVRDGRKKLYSALDVVKIMDALLKEKPTQRKPGARGGSEKKLWLSNPDPRKRVLGGILRRAYVLSTDKHIFGAFAAVVWRHLPIEYLKEQLPKGFERRVSALGRRYLD